MNEGYVYILSNPVMPGIVKIGFTTQDDINTRLAGLFTTGVPVPFEVEYACRIPDCQKVERALHRAFHPQRVHDKREFFEIEADQAISILELFEGIDLTSDVIRTSQSSAMPEDIAATRKMKRRRPNFNFYEMGFQPGDEIRFIPSLHLDNPITATVESGRTVRYENEVSSLTALTTRLKNSSHNVQPGPFWTSDRGDLSELYEETYG